MTFQELEKELQRVEVILPGVADPQQKWQLIRLRETLQSSVIKYYRLGYSPERLVA